MPQGWFAWSEPRPAPAGSTLVDLDDPVEGSFLDGSSAGEVQWLAMLGDEVRARPGELVATSQPESILLIVRGIGRVVRDGGVTGRVGAGEVLGVRPLPGMVVAATEMVALRFERSAFAKILDVLPDARARLGT